MDSIAKYLPIILTIIALAVGAAIYVSSANAENKDWTAAQDSATKVELRTEMRERYVPRYEFIGVKVKLESIEKILERLEKKVDHLQKSE
jgi:hypothetical protein